MLFYFVARLFLDLSIFKYASNSISTHLCSSSFEIELNNDS